jgi:hypothetical protein
MLDGAAWHITGGKFHGKVSAVGGDLRALLARPFLRLGNGISPSP